MTARDYTWLPVNLHQNVLQSLDLLSFLSLSHKASVFVLELPLGQEVFHWQPFINISPSTIINWSLSDFPPKSPVIRLGGFSPVTWFCKIYQLFYGARIFSLVFRFSFPVPQWVEWFFTKLYSYLHVRRSSRPREKAIVMSWSWYLKITGCTWSSYVSQPTHDLPTSSF